MSPPLRSPKDEDDRHGHHGDRPITLRDLKEFENRIIKIMATYQEALQGFIKTQNGFNDQVSAGIDAAQTALDGLSADVANLNAQIAALQNSSGTVTPEDQATIDAAQAAGKALADKLAAFDAAIAALDALTPPVVPPVVNAAAR